MYKYIDNYVNTNHVTQSPYPLPPYSSDFVSIAPSQNSNSYNLGGYMLAKTLVLYSICRLLTYI